MPKPAVIKGNNSTPTPMKQSRVPQFNKKRTSGGGTVSPDANSEKHDSHRTSERNSVVIERDSNVSLPKMQAQGSQQNL